MGLIIGGEDTGPAWKKDEREALDELGTTIMNGGLTPREIAMDGFMMSVICKVNINAITQMLIDGTPFTEESIAIARTAATRTVIAKLQDQLSKPIVATTSNVEAALRM
jgi:hypothetical protein